MFQVVVRGFPHLLPAVGVFDLDRLDIEHDAAHLHCHFHPLGRRLETLHLDHRVERAISHENKSKRLSTNRYSL